MRGVDRIRAAVLVLATGAAISSAHAAAPNGGSVSIETHVTGGVADASLPAFTGAMADALAAHGFTILDDAGHSAYVADVVLNRTEVGTGSARIKTGKASAGPGGVIGAAGVGAVIPLPGGTEEVPLQRTVIEVRIHQRGDPATVWGGSAVTIRPGGTKEGSDTRVAAALSQAVLSRYPQQPDQLIGVP